MMRRLSIGKSKMRLLNLKRQLGELIDESGPAIDIDYEPIDSFPSHDGEAFKDSSSHQDDLATEASVEEMASIIAPSVDVAVEEPSGDVAADEASPRDEPFQNLATDVSQETKASAHDQDSQPPSPIAPSDNVVGDYSPHDRAAEAAREKGASVRAGLPPSLMEHKRDCIAPFLRDEVALGPLLGSGEFSHVYEVSSFRLQPDVACGAKETEKRHYMKKSETYRQAEHGRYALKHIKGEYFEGCIGQDEPGAYVQAAADLALEAVILAHLDHPNIIKLRGATHSGTDGFVDGPGGYFLIIDRLFETLDQRMRRWRAEKSGLPEASKQLDSEQETLHERLTIALQLSAALMHLHSHSIVYRDLKPDNIGFDVDGNIRLFDFGLARIMPPNENHYDDVFEMSGAGSPRYMAPECLCGEEYNLKADVYSFSIIFWEVLSGEIAYGFAKTLHELADYVVMEDGRPHIPEGWPARIKCLLESGFGDMEERPKMIFVHRGIKATLAGLTDQEPLRVQGVTSLTNLEPLTEDAACHHTHGTSNRRLSSRGSSSLRSSCPDMRVSADELLADDF